MDDTIRNLIFRSIDQSISNEDFERLQELLEQDEAVRMEYHRALHLTEFLEDSSVDSGLEQTPASVGLPKRNAGFPFSPSRFFTLLAASAAVILVGFGSFWFGQKHGATSSSASGTTAAGVSDREEVLVAGHATLRRATKIQWGTEADSYKEGDVLRQGNFVFDTGVAEIDFFCGASLIVEGPAELSIESDWLVKVSKGRLRANVPPAARGFTVQAADAEIVDLGTEFALSVTTEGANVQVIDGEVELRGGVHDGKHLLTGEGESLTGKQAGANLFNGLSTHLELQQQRVLAERQRFAEWNTFSRQLSADDRLIAYFPIASKVAGRLVKNSATKTEEAGGLLVGPIEKKAGRFGPESSGVSFGRTGARIRTRIEGEYPAFTFACWAQIDSLEHRYNALFMGDGYENGEPHWQIRDDGSLMFSVMVDDSQDVTVVNEFDEQAVKDAGLHRVYFTKPFWDRSKSGQWFHLAAVYDPAKRRVNQYVNGELLSSQEIEDKFYISKLRIGPAEIGNWGQPFRDTPWFAVRNLNGTIDELAIFNAALPGDEIADLYQQGKPLGY